MISLRTIALLLLLPAAGQLMADSPLEFDDPWSPLAPPGRTMAGFVTIHNHGDSDIALVDATSPQFGRVEIHTMTMDEGVMRMRRLEELVVASGRMVVLQPGGRHLMLFEPSTEFENGDTIDVELIDSEGGTHAIELRVRPRN
jgi:periplasmic copper chaperone A